MASSPAFSDATTLVLGASPKKLRRSNAFLLEDDSCSTPMKSTKRASPPSTPTKVMKSSQSASSSPVQDVKKVKSAGKDVEKVKSPGKHVEKVKSPGKNKDVKSPGNNTNPVMKVMKVMKGKNDKAVLKVMKKPMMKRGPKKIKVLPKVTKKEQWDSDMNDVIMEYNDMVGYHKSFNVPPMSSWRVWWIDSLRERGWEPKKPSAIRKCWRDWTLTGVNRRADQ